MRRRRGSKSVSSSIRSSRRIPARSARSMDSSIAARRTGAASVSPRATTSRPCSSSLRKRMSSTSSVISSTSVRAFCRSAGTSAAGSSADSRRVMSRASGVRSSWETDAVNAARSSSYWSGGTRVEYRVTKVLIVEDDELIAEGMAQHLAAAGLEPVRVGAGEVGLARLRYERPDVVVLDLMLPGLDGWGLIGTARQEGIGTPILVVSARGTEHDRVHALQIGADDYLVKPFSMKELVARVQAAARRGVRGVPEDRGEELVIEELRIDPRSVQAFVDGENAELTPTEFRLLYALAQDRGRVASRDELLQRIWGRRATHRDRTVDVCVRRLREKIDARAPRHTFIQTRYGVGYSLEPVPKS